MNYKDFMKLAHKHYNSGGDGYCECWDEITFACFVQEFGEITEERVLAMFATAEAVRKDVENA